MNKLHKKPDGLIKNVIVNFLDNHKVIIPPDRITHLPTEEVYSYRLCKRDRDNSRSGGVLDEYNSRAKGWFKDNFPGQYYDGQKKWDLLVAKMKEEGWKINNPAVIIVRRKNRCRLWDGHHRVCIALELGIKVVPVQFKYRTKEL